MKEVKRLVVLTTEGEIRRKKFPVPSDQFGDLETLQDAVGGFIELAHTYTKNNKVYTFYCNEEGLLKRDPKPNPFLPKFVGDIAVEILDEISFYHKNS
ncbi:DUF3846 domain-containing protein [Leptospira levettii]|uniref:DUF3846 domain-containing protein n=1 Tax=Leptospira levettii TaxID=2023178 RepID=UPI000C2A3CA2|nr:DUF3846 domain-containing protein [Leptospira levettii]PJZ87354.1 hypothetical protein CH368_17315 [Leptospira levettii]